jgi:hypothetical protein
LKQISSLKRGASKARGGTKEVKKVLPFYLKQIQT